MNMSLARVAFAEARLNYHGDTCAAISNLQPLAELFDVVDEVTLETLNADWSGAFAYWCAEKAGLGLPIRYPDPRVRASFATVAAWEDYARLPKINLWRFPGEELEPGDFVFFETKDGEPGQMAIVLRVNEDTIDIAMGNYHNHSAVTEHSLTEGIRGSIRIEE